MPLSDSFFGQKFGLTEHDLQSYLSEALNAGGDYADLYFEYLVTSQLSIDESIVKSAIQGVSLGVGVRVIAGERTGYAYSDDLSPDKIRKAARVAACIANGPSKVDKTGLEEVRGRDLISGLPRKTGVTSEEIREALQEPITQIIDAVKRTLEMAEPELAADLVENGITMAGGSSLLRGITTVISNATGLDVRLAEDPLTCVARGTSVYLENLELWKETMESDADEG